MRIHDPWTPDRNRLEVYYPAGKQPVPLRDLTCVAGALRAWDYIQQELERADGPPIPPPHLRSYAWHPLNLCWPGVPGIEVEFRVVCWVWCVPTWGTGQPPLVIERKPYEIPAEMGPWLCALRQWMCVPAGPGAPGGYRHRATLRRDAAGVWHITHRSM